MGPPARSTAGKSSKLHRFDKHLPVLSLVSPRLLIVRSFPYQPISAGFSCSDDFSLPMPSTRNANFS